MDVHAVPSIFLQLQSNGLIREKELAHTQDGFWMLCRSLADLLARKEIFDFPDAGGTRLACDRFFDDWFLFAVPSESDYVYSLVKLREQEHDAVGDAPADGDTPGVTVSFVPFACRVLLDCLSLPTDENRRRLDGEIDRVVVRRGQRHHESLKRYFINPRAEAPYLIVDRYVKQIASLAANATIDVPEHYRELARRKHARVRRLIEALNQAAGRVVCDHEKIYLQNAEHLTEQEYDAILITHTSNPSRYSFAAEVAYHTRFLTPLARIRMPFLKKSVYDSAVRADMTIGDAEWGGFAPFYRESSRIVKQQYELHQKLPTEENK